MTRATCLLLCSLIGAGHPLLAQAEPQESWTLKKALKQMDKAAKAAGPLTAEVNFTTTDPAAAVHGTGTMFFSGDGSARVDIPGDNPAIGYWLYAYLVTYNVNRNELTTVNFYLNPQVLAQYAIIGFSPAGSEMKKDWEINLNREEMLGEEPVLFLVLTPKDKELKKTIQLIRLWISTKNWFPAKQEVLHVAQSLKLTVYFNNVQADEERPPSFFRPKVPPGATKISK